MDNVGTSSGSIALTKNIPTTQTNADNSDMARLPNTEGMTLLAKRWVNNPTYDSKTPPDGYDEYELITPENSNRSLMLDNFIKILSKCEKEKNNKIFFDVRETIEDKHSVYKQGQKRGVQHKILQNAIQSFKALFKTKMRIKSKKYPQKSFSGPLITPWLRGEEELMEDGRYHIELNPMFFDKIYGDKKHTAFWVMEMSTFFLLDHKKSRMARAIYMLLGKKWNHAGINKPQTREASIPIKEVLEFTIGDKWQEGKNPGRMFENLRESVIELKDNGLIQTYKFTDTKFQNGHNPETKLEKKDFLESRLNIPCPNNIMKFYNNKNALPNGGNALPNGGK